MSGRPAPRAGGLRGAHMPALLQGQPGLLLPLPLPLRQGLSAGWVILGEGSLWGSGAQAGLDVAGHWRETTGSAGGTEARGAHAGPQFQPPRNSTLQLRAGYGLGASADALSWFGTRLEALKLQGQAPFRGGALPQLRPAPPRPQNCAASRGAAESL